MSNLVWENIVYFFRAWTDYLFRRRLPGLWLLHIAAVILLSLIAGFTFKASTPIGDFSFSTGGTPNWLFIAVFSIIVLFVIVGIVWTERELKAQNRKKVIVIELRGLRDTSGCPLTKAVPRKLAGRHDQLLVNLRQGQDGKISAPAAALRRLASIPNDLATRVEGIDREDISYVLGGLAPVPLSFLAGILTDDECAITLMDWNRHTEKWTELDASDDGKRFEIVGLDALRQNASEAVLIVSVSYIVDRNGVMQKIPNAPIVNMELDGSGPDAHWSQEKQIALGRQFLETMIALGNKGVQTVHLFLAAPNSVVLRLGRLYDKRNLPAVIVYQYERQETPPYPWGIKMPVEGSIDATLIT